MAEAAVLHVIGGNDRGKLFELTRAETRIGRGTDQDLVLADIAISRRHVTILREGSRYRLRDLGSGNGTLLNSQKVDTVLLNDGDQIELGNTLMRFDHGASKPLASAAPLVSSTRPPAANAANTMPPQMKPATSAPPVRAASLAAQAAASESPDATPSDAISNPVAPLPTSSTDRGALEFAFKLVDTRVKQIAIFGAMAVMLFVGMGIVVNRFFFVKPQVVASDAEQAYRQGLRQFATGDYAQARLSFAEAAKLEPESAEAKRYVRQCDTEVNAKNAMDSAQKSLAAQHYVDAEKALSSVESISVRHDSAMVLYKKNAQAASVELIDLARRTMSTDPKAASDQLNDALRYDPESREARDLLSHPQKNTTPTTPSTPVFVKQSETTVSKKHKEVDLAPLPPLKEEKISKGGGALIESRVAMVAYRGKDFATAESALRQDAKTQSGKQAQRLNEAANDLKQLKSTLDRAQGEEQKSPDQAVKDYQTAFNLDAKVSRGVQAPYIRGKLGKAQNSWAQQAFQQGKLDEAFRAAREGQKMGTGDGGVLKQLEGKAVELTNKGLNVQKSNLTQAKSYWRMVLKIVPDNSATYLKAYNLINNSVGPHKDEDED